MPAILFVVLGGGVIAYLLSKSPPAQGTPLPPVLPGQAPGTSFGPSPGMLVPTSGPPPGGLVNLGAFTHHLGVANFASNQGAGIGMPPGHDAAPVVIPSFGPPPTPVPVQVPNVQHVMVATHDTGPTGNLAIRTAPSKSGRVLTEAPHGSVLAVTGANVDDPAVPGGWSPVLQENSGIQGYSASSYLKAI
jgi:hypothetical protein